MDEIGKEKDKIALQELNTIIGRLNQLALFAGQAVGHSRPIINAAEIELIKDHLDLVVKYTRL